MDLFHFDAGLTLWTLITFGVLLLLLSRFAFGPLRRVLDEREAAIRRTLDRSEEARREAEALLERNREQLAAAREETRRIVEEGHKTVNDMKREAQQQAKREADAIVERARGEIDREVRRGLDGMKATIAGLAVRISRQVVQESVDERAHEKLADDFVERLKRMHGGKP